MAVLDASARDFRVGGTVLSMPVDESWIERRDPNDPPDTIGLESKVPGRFRFMVTPWPAGVPSPDDAAIRGRVEQRAAQMAPRTKEKKLAVHDIRGTDSQGYYFSATDPSNKPGEYRYLHQGISSSGGRVVAFTAFYNDGGEKDAAAALAAVRGLRFK